MTSKLASPQQRRPFPRSMVLAVCAIAAVVIVGAVWVTRLLAGNAADESLTARRERIAAMSAAEKEQLKVKQERFAKLDANEQAKLRKLHDAVEVHPRRAELTRVMMRYRQWLRELTPEDRATLLTTETSKRLAVAQGLQEKLHQRYLAEAGKEMSETDARAVKDWMDALCATRIPAALEAASERQKGGLERAIKEKQKHFVRGIVWDLIYRGKLPPVTEEDHARLAAAVSAERRQTFERAKTKEERERVANAWIMGATFFRRGFGGPGPSPEDLQAELAKLPPDERKRVSTLPPEQMRDILHRKWFESRFNPRGGRGGPGDRGPGERGPGDRGPPGDRGQGDRGPGDRDGPPFGGPGRGRDGDERRGRGPDRRDDDRENGDRRGRDDRKDEDRRGGGRGGRRDDQNDREDRKEGREPAPTISHPTKAPSASEP